MTRKNATVDHDSSGLTADADDQAASPITVEPTATATVAATRTTTADAGDAEDALPNTLTIIGQGTPSSFEITVDGEIDLADDPRDADATVVSGTTVEGTIESDTVTFRFTGDLTDVTFVDRGITGQEPATTPNVHVDYDAPDGVQS
ncbi:hypothetical protein [Natrinema versiforme]|uniref:Uncharacterized protein n=1 Tax=Natrinema versiforme JCM 10478 TaxID=1227496 RepID=L9Y3X4_9EURY|nr:hypothetical protein [Natrinema versiforme]ELY67558.1 hypothetical protein C489_10719 [Natrinema versiforme JCM 10478]